MKIKWSLAGVLITLIVFSGCSTIRKSPNFERRASQIRTVAIMPADVAIQRVVFKGADETLFDEGKTASQKIAETLSVEMRKRGYEVKLLAMDSEILNQNPLLKEEVSKLRDRYATLVADVQKQYVSKMKWGNFMLSLGSDVNQIVDAVGADVLIFSTGSGFVKSGGEISSDIAKTLLIGAASLGSVIYVAPSAGGQIFISIVDGDNGEMLWHNFSNPALQINLTHQSNVQKLVKTVMSRYPKCVQKGSFSTEEMNPEVETKISIIPPVASR